MRTSDLVVDASALFDWMQLGALPASRRLHAPSLIDYEMLSTVRRHVRLGQLDADRATNIVSALGELDLRRHSAHAVRERMWHLRHNLTSSDASYVALAQLLGIPLVTADAKLAAAAAQYCDVERV